MPGFDCEYSVGSQQTSDPRCPLYAVGEEGGEHRLGAVAQGLRQGAAWCGNEHLVGNDSGGDARPPVRIGGRCYVSGGHNNMQRRREFVVGGKLFFRCLGFLGQRKKRLLEIACA